MKTNGKEEHVPQMEEYHSMEMEDVLRIEISQARMLLAGADVREKHFEDKLDELTTIVTQLQLQLKLQELTIARSNNARVFEAKIKKATSDYENSGKSHEDLKCRLGEKYNVKDWTKVAYDDLTGRLTLLPESTIGEN